MPVRTAEPIPASYFNWMPFEVVDTPTGFSIKARTIPAAKIALTTIGIALGFAFFLLLPFVAKPGDMHVSRREFFTWSLAIGIPTVIGTPWSIWAYYRRQIRRGPVFVFDLYQQTIELPRLSKRFSLDAIESLYLVRDAAYGSERGFQVQLLASDGGNYLVLTAETVQALQPILDTLRARIPSLPYYP
jgi:hypothetical protein